MGDGIWHTTIPITDEHIFLHLLRSVYIHQHGLKSFINDYNAELFSEHLIEWGRIPSPYVKAYQKKSTRWKRPQWHVEITELGKYYCDYVYTYADKLDCDKYSYFYIKNKDGYMEKIPNAAARFRERLPLILYNYGFSSRADYAVKWSIFKGALGQQERAPLPSGQRLNIFDNLSEGIPSRKEADRTVCMPVEELI